MKRRIPANLACIFALSVALLGSAACTPDGALETVLEEDLESIDEEDLEGVAEGDLESVDGEVANQLEQEAIDLEQMVGGSFQGSDEDNVYFYNANGCGEAVARKDVNADGTIKPNACRVTLCWCAAPRSGDPECAHQGCTDPQPACCNLIRRFCAPSVACSQMLIRPAPGPC